MPLTAPTSEVAICNLALIKLKEPSITNITEITNTSSKAEGLCSDLYQQIRRETLRMHTWNFAAERTTIAPDATAPLFQFTHKYLLPTDYIRYIARFDDIGQAFIPGVRGLDYDIEGEFYLFNGTDATSINFRYIKDFTTVSKFDPLFVRLFALNLAIELAPNFSASPTVKRDLIIAQADVKSEAMAIDGQERPPTRIETSRWRTARRQGPRNDGKFIVFD